MSMAGGKSLIKGWRGPWPNMKNKWFGGQCLGQRWGWKLAGEHWGQTLFKEYRTASVGGKLIHCIGKQGFAENDAPRLILP